MTKIKQIWKDVVGYEGKYKISNLGNVKRVISGRVLKRCFEKYRYVTVTLSVENIKLTKQIHRLVADAFIPNPQNKPCVNHIDGDKHNCAKSNLEWATYSENELHSYSFLGKIATKYWEGKRGSENFSSKKTIQLSMDGKFIMEHESSILAVEHLRKNGYPKATQGSLGCALRGKYHHAYGHKWKYSNQ